METEDFIGLKSEVGKVIDHRFRTRSMMGHEDREEGAMLFT